MSERETGDERYGCARLGARAFRVAGRRARGGPRRAPLADARHRRPRPLWNGARHTRRDVHRSRRHGVPTVPGTRPRACPAGSRADADRGGSATERVSFFLVAWVFEQGIPGTRTSDTGRDFPIAVRVGPRATRSRASVARGALGRRRGGALGAAGTRLDHGPASPD